jgi:hypothetical protein
MKAAASTATTAATPTRAGAEPNEPGAPAVGGGCEDDDGDGTVMPWLETVLALGAQRPAVFVEVPFCHGLLVVYTPAGLLELTPGTTASTWPAGTDSAGGTKVSLMGVGQGTSTISSSATIWTVGRTLATLGAVVVGGVMVAPAGHTVVYTSTVRVTTTSLW